jgi:hypothetical protein
MTFQVCTQMHQKNDRHYVGMVYGVASQRIKHSLKWIKTHFDSADNMIDNNDIYIYIYICVCVCA